MLSHTLDALRSRLDAFLDAQATLRSLGLGGSARTYTLEAYKASPKGAVQKHHTTAFDPTYLPNGMSAHDQLLFARTAALYQDCLQTLLVLMGRCVTQITQGPSFVPMQSGLHLRLIAANNAPKFVLAFHSNARSFSIDGNAGVFPLTDAFPGFAPFAAVATALATTPGLGVGKTWMTSNGALDPYGSNAWNDDAFSSKVHAETAEGALLMALMTNHHAAVSHFTGTYPIEVWEQHPTPCLAAAGLAPGCVNTHPNPATLVPGHITSLFL